MRHSLRCCVLVFITGAFLLAPSRAAAQTGSGSEPVRYIGGVTVHQQAHDGQLRPAVGVESYQVMRANRSKPELADNFGWTYNHAPMITYWNNRFYLEYLSDPTSELGVPGQTLVATSLDGRNWAFPQVVFPVYKLLPPDPEGTALMHQRMGFYIAPNGRLLVMAFYGHSPNWSGKGGIGRVVREAYKDGTFGPIYFLRFNSRSGWNESNTGYPFYRSSTDPGFVDACDSMLGNRLMREQSWDEEHFDDDFFSVKSKGSQEAFNWFHRKDGTIVGLWKWSMAALSSDEGKTWTKPVKLPTLVMAGAKIWGQKTSDGRYALIYNPVNDGWHRWPLAIVTSDDGITFDNMLCVQGEVPQRRFNGYAKDFGSQYNRSIEEGNGKIPGSDIWDVYSMNKEDIWISRIPVPVRNTVTGPVKDTFDTLKAGGQITDWNIYSPRWAPVRVVDFPSVANKSLELQDKDPYDYARAIRVFQEGKNASLSFKIQPKQSDVGRMEIEVVDRYGSRPVRVVFAGDGKIKAMNGSQLEDIAPFQADKWYSLRLKVDVPRGVYSVSIDGKPVLNDAVFAEYVKRVERISFRTGVYRTAPPRTVGSKLRDEQPDVTNPNPDAPEPPAVYCIDDVVITSGTGAAAGTTPAAAGVPRSK
jgi:hypothetical protein